MNLSADIPTEFLDLVDGPPAAALTTLMPDGRPQTTVVWCDFDGECLRVNTMRGFRKERNMRLNPRVTLLCFDPREPLRYLEVRGVVEEMTEAGASKFVVLPLAEPADWADHLGAVADAVLPLTR